MKQKHLFSLLDTSFTTVRVVFKNNDRDVEADDGSYSVQTDRFQRPVLNSVKLSKGRGQRSYIYKAPKDMGVELDDVVIVGTPSNGLVTALVVQVDEVAQIDVDADFEYKWVVQKVDRTDYDARVERERKFGEMMLEVERVNRREKLLGDMRANLPDGSQARLLFDRATSMVGGVEPQPEAPLGGKTVDQLAEEAAASFKASLDQPA